MASADLLEKVELVVEKTGVSYEDARFALESNKKDVLDAIIWLEREGKTKTASANYTTQPQDSAPISPEMEQAQNDYQHSSRRSKIGNYAKSIGEEAKGIFSAGFETSFVVERHGKRILSVPTLVLIFLVLWWGAAIPLLITGLVLGCHYHFEGDSNLARGVNETLDGASEVVSDMVDSIKDNFSDEEEDV